MNRCLLIVLLLTTFSPALPAQEILAESELSFLQKQPADSAMVNRLNRYAEKIQFSSPQIAIEAMNASISAAQKID